MSSNDGEFIDVAVSFTVCVPRAAWANEFGIELDQKKIVEDVREYVRGDVLGEHGGLPDYLGCKLVKFGRKRVTR